MVKDSQPLIQKFRKIARSLLVRLYFLSINLFRRIV